MATKNKQLQMYNSEVKKKLDANLILTISNFDGNRKRLWRIELELNSAYFCKIDMSFYNVEITASNKVSHQIGCELPENLKALVVSLINLKHLRLYSSYGCSLPFLDLGESWFTINHNGKTHFIVIDSLATSNNENESETLLINLHDAFEIWFNDIYQYFGNF